MSAVCKVPLCEGLAKRKGTCHRHFSVLSDDDGGRRKRRAPNGALEQFVRAVAHSSIDQCIPWPFGKIPDGYGMLKIDGVNWRAHRAVLVLASGQNHPDMWALHLPEVCHNRACVNPRHLRWGSAADNQADMEIDGTWQRGEKGARAILSKEAVIEMRKSSKSNTFFAEQYGVHKSTIAKARNGKNWSHLSV